MGNKDAPDWLIHINVERQGGVWMCTWPTNASFSSLSVHSGTPLMRWMNTSLLSTLTRCVLHSMYTRLLPNVSNNYSQHKLFFSHRGGGCCFFHKCKFELITQIADNSSCGMLLLFSGLIICKSGCSRARPGSPVPRWNTMVSLQSQWLHLHHRNATSFRLSFYVTT